MAFRHVVIALFFVLQTTAWGQQLEYDRKGAMGEQLYNEAVLRTRVCMRRFGEAQLSTGARDQGQIASNVAKVCGFHIRNVVENFMKRPDLMSSTNDFILALAYEELGRIPGVKLAPPQK